MDNYKPILHIEDDQVDCMTVRRILKTLGIANKLIQKVNGEDALNYLTGQDNEKPGMILLDINMPRMNGREFLQIVRKDPDLRSIPVVILTTSNIDRDLIGANVVSYIIKSAGFDDFVTSLKSEFEKLSSHCVAASNIGRDLIGENVIGYIFKSTGFDDFITSLKSQFEKLSPCQVP